LRHAFLIPSRDPGRLHLNISLMLKLITFLQTLIVSVTIMCVICCFMRFTAYCVLWLIGKLLLKPADDPHRHADRTPLRMLPKT
jgi:hypothetical protein